MNKTLNNLFLKFFAYLILKHSIRHNDRAWWQAAPLLMKRLRRKIILN